MHQAIQDRIGQGWIGKVGVPVLYRDLRGQERRSPAEASMIQRRSRAWETVRGSRSQSSRMRSCPPGEAFQDQGAGAIGVGEDEVM